MKPGPLGTVPKYKLMWKSPTPGGGRFRGLMLRKPLPPAAGLWLNPTNSIHMCFMRFAIDAVYFNKNMEIVKIVRNLHPWLGLSACLKASSVLELKAGEAERLGLKVGLQAAGREP